MADTGPTDEDILHYSIVKTALEGIVAIPLLVFFVLSLCLARRRHDPARVGFTWLKVAFAFEFLAVFFLVVSDATFSVLYGYIVNDDSLYGTVDSQGLFTLNMVTLRTALLAAFLQHIADILTVITMVCVAGGFIFAASQTRPVFAQVLYYVSMGAGVVLFALAAAAFGKLNSAWSDYYGDAVSFGTVPFENSVKLNAELRIVHQLQAAYDILQFIISVALVVYAIIVLIRYVNQPSRSSSIILLVATILWFIRWIWFVVFDARWEIPDDLVDVPNAYNVVDPILNVWLFFVVLVLLFVIGMRKQNGLWSSQQGWNLGAGPKPAIVQQPSYMYGQPPQPTAYGAPGTYVHPQQQQQQPMYYAAPAPMQQQHYPHPVSAASPPPAPVQQQQQQQHPITGLPEAQPSKSQEAGDVVR